MLARSLLKVEFFKCSNLKVRTFVIVSSTRLASIIFETVYIVNLKFMKLIFLYIQQSIYIAFL